MSSRGHPRTRDEKVKLQSWGLDGAVMFLADMGNTQIVRFDSTQSQKVLIATQLMTHNGFQELIQINSRLEMIFWNLIQIDS